MTRSTKPSKKHVVVVGGGAAGFFAAIRAAEAHPDWNVSLLERTSRVLAKVLVSGGGRCNVTHACFDPAELVTHYPRGSAALRGPFSRFQPRDTVEWFESRGVPLKTEPDNRIFPQSDRSQSIAECLEKEAARLGVAVRTNVLIQTIRKEKDVFLLELDAAAPLVCDRLVLATGSNPLGWVWAKGLGHTIVPPVPSLFTFMIRDPRLQDLEGLSVSRATVALEGTSFKQTGDVLITHWGLSGPAILKLSAWGARSLHERAYHAAVRINWMSEREEPVLERLIARREGKSRNLLAVDNFKEIPRRLWSRLADAAGVPYASRWAQVGNDHLRALARQLTQSTFEITGRGVYKEEFVTAGGVDLDEVDFRTLESKCCPGLFFAGEILDIDAETGGFNFQNAWTTGWIAGQSLGS